MKVLLINNFHSRTGGAHAVYLNTAELLKKNGHEVYYFSLFHEGMIPYENSKYFPKFIEYRNISFLSKIFSAFKFIYSKESSKKLEIYLKVIKPDIAHVHLYLGGLTVSVLDVLKKSRIPVVHTSHDFRLICPAYLMLDAQNQICEKCKSNKFYNCLLNKCSDNKLTQSTILTFDAYFRMFFKDTESLIKSIIFVSKFSRKKHIEFGFGKNLVNNVLYNFMPDLNNLKPNHTKGNYFLFFGRISREKGVVKLIEAFAKTSVNLKVVGEGPLYPILRNSNSEKIEFLGYKSGDELVEIIRNASFVVVPSLCYENNPMTIIEAYSYGKPVLGSNIGGIPEIIIHGKTGFVFNPENQKEFIECIKIADGLTVLEYEEFSRNARLFADNHFEPDNHLKELTKIYNKAIYD